MPSIIYLSSSDQTNVNQLIFVGKTQDESETRLRESRFALRMDVRTKSNERNKRILLSPARNRQRFSKLPLSLFKPVTCRYLKIQKKLFEFNRVAPIIMDPENSAQTLLTITEQAP
jgi:hypothetical protein